jgi:ribosomal protein L2
LTADAFIVRFEKDSFRTSTIALVFYQTGFLSYVILPDGYSPGDKLRFSLSTEFADKAALFLGNALQLKNVPEGALVFNVEM